MKIQFNEELTLENDRVRLSPLKTEDLHSLLAISSKYPDLVQYSPHRIHTEEFLSTFIALAMRAREEEKRYAFSVFDKRAGCCAGSTSFMNISNHDLRLEIGATWIGKEFQGTKLNPNMKRLMLEYAFETLGYERVEFRTDERNMQSRTAMEKIGCRLEGILRSHTLLTDGHRRNSAVYSIIRSEWPNSASVIDRLLQGSD